MSRTETTTPTAVIPAARGTAGDDCVYRSEESASPTSFARYAKYKDSGVDWLGEIPETWTAIALSRVLAEPVADGPHTTPEFIEEGIPFLSVDGIQDGNLVFEGCRLISRADHEAFSRKCQPRRDDILLGKAASVGKVARVQCDFDFSIWSPLALIRVDQSVCRPEFLEYALKSPEVQAQIQTKANSNTQYNIGMKDIPILRFALPALPEQMAVIAFLDSETTKIDALIAEQEKLIALLKEKRQALISHAVTQGLDPNVPMKDSGVEWLGKVPAHWMMKRLKHISPFITVGIVVNPSNYVADEGLPFIYGGDISEGSIALETARRISPQDSQRNAKTKLQAGDVLTVRVGAPGVTAVAGVECEGGNCASVMLTRRGDYDSRWLCFAMNSRMVRYQVEIVQYGAAQEQFNISHAINFWFATPSKTEQAAIADVLTDDLEQIDELKLEAQHAIALLKERRSALISAAVTGKIVVRNAP